MISAARFLQLGAPVALSQPTLAAVIQVRVVRTAPKSLVKQGYAAFQISRRGDEGAPDVFWFRLFEVFPVTGIVGRELRQGLGCLPAGLPVIHQAALLRLGQFTTEFLLEFDP